VSAAITSPMSVSVSAWAAACSGVWSAGLAYCAAPAWRPSAGCGPVVIAMDRHAYGDAAARQRPAGYRLAQRALALAARLGLPVLTLVDTPGADPGPQAEADGVAGEIARTLLAMSDLPVPTVALCIGEGGSGGAMALAHTDRLLMLSGAVFPVIGPEAGAAILYRDAVHAPALARSLRLTAAGLYALGAVDGLIEEDAPDLVRRVRGAILAALSQAQPGEREARVTHLADRSLDGAQPARQRGGALGRRGQ
jgi:acetyl-CoA carboxylase alpha subunit